MGKKLGLAVTLWVLLGPPLSWVSASDDPWERPRFGVTLQETNQELNRKNPQLRIEDDLSRAEIELQYSPTKSIKLKRGRLTAWVIAGLPSSPGRLFGYAYEGLFFGRVVYFKDHPEIFPETAPKVLKEKYPQGKLIRLFGSTHRPISYFECKTEDLYLFTTERGIYYYDPAILERMIKVELERIEQQTQRMEKESRQDLPQAGTPR